MVGDFVFVIVCDIVVDVCLIFCVFDMEICFMLIVLFICFEFGCSYLFGVIWDGFGINFVVFFVYVYCI